jgi:hypothetical protein
MALPESRAAYYRRTRLDTDCGKGMSAAPGINEQLVFQHDKSVSAPSGVECPGEVEVCREREGNGISH